MSIHTNFVNTIQYVQHLSFSVHVCACVCVYLHVEVWVDVLLFHQLFDLFTPLDQLPDFFGQDSHLQVCIWNFGNLLRPVLLLPWKQELEFTWKSGSLHLCTWAFGPIHKACLVL